MNQDFFEKKLHELVNELGPLPEPVHEKLLQVAENQKETQRKLRSNIESLQESLDYLRVSLKYLLFDLEATRRENAYLKKLLEDKN